MNEKKSKKVAKNLVQKMNLVIGNEEFEIVTTSIHAQRVGYWDPFVQTKGRKNRKWFIYNNDFNRYIDLDFSLDGETCGLRINTLRSVDNKELIISTAGDVYDYVEKKLGNKKFKRMNGLSFEKRENSELYIKKRNVEFHEKIFEIPRYGKYNDFKYKSRCEYFYMFFPLMFTTSLDWIPKKTDFKKIPIVLYLYMKGYKTELIEKEIISEKLLDKYIQNSIRAQSPNDSMFWNTNKTGFGAQQVCEMFQHFASAHLKGGDL
jgi:hypothetical protein